MGEEGKLIPSSPKLTYHKNKRGKKLPFLYLIKMRTKSIKIFEEEWLELTKMKINLRMVGISEVITMLRKSYINQKKQNKKKQELGK